MAKAVGESLRDVGLVGGALGGLLIAGLVIDSIQHDGITGRDHCTDKTQVLMRVGDKGIRGWIHGIYGDNNNASWRQVAEVQTKRRYFIDPVALQRVNPALVQYDKNNNPKNSLPPGQYCFKLEAPIIGGQDSADGSKTVAEEAKDYGLQTDELIRKNAKISSGWKPDTIPQEGLILDVSSPTNKHDPNIVLLRSPDDLSNMPELAGQLGNDVVAANGRRIWHAEVYKGDDVFLPVSRGPADIGPILKAYGLTR